MGTGNGTGKNTGEGFGDCSVRSMGSKLSTLGLFCDSRPPDLVRYRFAGGFGGAGFTGGGIAFGCEGSETGSGTGSFHRLLLRFEGEEDLAPWFAPFWVGKSWLELMVGEDDRRLAR